MSTSWIREAMREYEKAEAISPPGNEDAILRWNACVRFCQREERFGTAPAELKMTLEPVEDDEMPIR